MRIFKSGFGNAAIVLMGITASGMAQAATAPAPQATPIPPAAAVQAIVSSTTPALSLQSTARAASALLAPASGLQIDLSGPLTR